MSSDATSASSGLAPAASRAMTSFDPLETPLSPPPSGIGAVARLVVASMPRPSFSPWSDTNSYHSRRNLSALLTVSTDFFHAAAEALWESPTSIKVLVQVLLNVNVGVEGEAEWSMASRSPDENEKYIFDRVARLIRHGDSHNDSAFSRFHFYASCIVRLRVVSPEVPTTLLRYLSSLVVGGERLLPRLQELSWVESQPCMSAGDIATFMCFSRVSVLTLRFQDQPSITLTAQGRDFYADSVVVLFAALSDTAPQLRELTVHVPSAIALPVSAILRFEALRRANLHLSILGATDHSPALEPIRVEFLEALEVHWTFDTDFNTVASILDQGQLRELVVMVYHHLGHKFLYDMFSLTSRAPSYLTRVEIFALSETALPTASARLIDHFRPLLGRRSLQHVTLVLTGYRFDVCPFDLVILARAWPDLRYLNLSFPLNDYGVLPNLSYILPTICDLCPRLEFLHLPAVSTTSRHGIFHLPSLSHCALEHVSSDSALFEHTVLDIAWSLHIALPRIQHVGSTCDDTDGWFDTNAMLQALKDKDYATIFEHVAKCIRAGEYQTHPPFSLLLIVLAAFGYLPR